MKVLKTLLPYIIIIIAVVLIRTFIVTPIEVVGISMNPTLKDGDIMILDKISYKFNDIKRFDIVVIKTEDDPIIKRVIGLPGDEVYIQNGVVYVNDKKLKQTFTYNISDDDYTILDAGYAVIPKDMYFVLGDNRPNSADSRVIGLIKKSDILGKTSLVIFPFSRFGTKE